MTIALLLGSGVLVACGGGSDPGFDLDGPASTVVADAARATLALEPAGIALEVESPQGGYRAEGLIEPGAGRFRVEARGDGRLSPSGGVTAVGMPEDGKQVTLREEYTRYQGAPQRCWYATHAPVGGNVVTASVQEAVHLTVSALKSMRPGVRRATRLGDDREQRRYTVTLERAMTAGAGGGSFYREASLRQRLAGPVRATISQEGIVTALRLRLHGYRPVSGWGARKLDPRPVSIDARISPTTDELDLTPAPCVGTE